MHFFVCHLCDAFISDSVVSDSYSMTLIFIPIDSRPRRAVIIDENNYITVCDMTVNMYICEFSS